MKRKAREIFTLLNIWAWSVDAAQDLVRERQPNTLLSLETLAPELLHIGKASPTRPVNLDIPIIAIPSEYFGILPIDGYHRIQEALKQGRSSLSCHLLSADEAILVRMAKCPWKAYEASEKQAAWEKGRAGEVLTQSR
jgi:hypothetical protein